MTIIYNFMYSCSQQSPTGQNSGIQNLMNSFLGNSLISNGNQMFGNAFQNNNYNSYSYPNQYQNACQCYNPYQYQNPYTALMNNLSRLLFSMMNLLMNSGLLNQALGNGTSNTSSYGNSGCSKNNCGSSSSSNCRSSSGRSCSSGSRISCGSTGSTSSSGCSGSGSNSNINYNSNGVYSPGTYSYVPMQGKGIMNTSVLPQTSQTAALKNHFDNTYSQKAGMENASDTDVNGMYNEYISCDSLVKMYRSTGDTSYIDKACQLANAYIDTGKDMDGDGYKDWKAKDISQGMNHDHYEWRAADGVAELANQINSNPTLKQKYAAQGQKYAQFIEKDVWEKWNNKVGRCGAINKVPSEEHFIARIGKIALNMYNCTGDPKYKNWLDQNVPKLQKAIARDGDIMGTINGGSMDNGHTADTADFISECYKAGLYFTKSDMQNLANAAKRRGLPPGWVKLAQFDQSLYNAYMNNLNSYRYRDGANVTANLAAMTAEGLMT